jgi:hypothetical protein
LQYHMTFQIVDNTMTNIQKINLSKIVDFVPDPKFRKFLQLRTKSKKIGDQQPSYFRKKLNKSIQT